MAVQQTKLHLALAQMLVMHWVHLRSLVNEMVTPRYLTELATATGKELMNSGIGGWTHFLKMVRSVLLKGFKVNLVRDEVVVLML